MFFNRYFLIISCLLGSVFGSYSPSIAADNVIVTYGILRESLSVEELTEFCETGEPSSEIDFYLRASKQNPEQVREILTREIPVNGVVLSDVLNNFLGSFILDNISEVITTPSERASRESLRGALVTSALKDNNISIIEILQNYPTSEVHLKADRLLEVYQQLDSVVNYHTLNPRL